MNRRDDPFLPQTARIQRGALVAGLLGLLAAGAGLFLAGLESFFQAYLFAYLFWLGISLGLLAMTMIWHLAGGRWGIAIQRIFTAGSKTVWLFAILLVPILVGVSYLYPWAQPEVVSGSAVLQFKQQYLNTPFFILRAALYFLVWIGLAYFLTRRTGAQQAGENLQAGGRRRSLSALGLILYVLTMTFAALDWNMSLQPDWQSTLFGLLVVVTQSLAGLAFAILVLAWLVRFEPLSSLVTPRHYRDLGALLLTVVSSWAYLAFSQFLIVWYGNLPHEVTWYLARTTGGWQWLILIVFALQFLLPFLVLLSLQAKRNLRVLAGLAAVILASALIYEYWLVIPPFFPTRMVLNWVALATPVAIGGIWIALFLWYLNRTPPLWIEARPPTETVKQNEPGRAV